MTEPIKPVGQQMLEVILHVWTNSVTVSSDFARKYAPIVAACASEGYLTTRIGNGIYTPMWLVTPIGLEYLGDHHPDIEF